MGTAQWKGAWPVLQDWILEPWVVANWLVVLDKLLASSGAQVSVLSWEWARKD